MQAGNANTKTAACFAGTATDKYDQYGSSSGCNVVKDASGHDLGAGGKNFVYKISDATS